MSACKCPRLLEDANRKRLMSFLLISLQIVLTCDESISKLLKACSARLKERV